ncbi:GAF domain-containing protein [Variovorax sp. KK3]|uniref:GAF domain-containing protein n=1 Tax=Variovorax sp. KK3 TaxID=1855728 RepID=UPI0009F89BE6|nr:GAF domain-containing protein [Variovorax sp. KK3]
MDSGDRAGGEAFVHRTRATAAAFTRQLKLYATVTSDADDARIDRAVRDVLKLVREHLQMDLAFVSNVRDGRRAFRNIDPPDGRQLIEEGASDPEEVSFCRQVIDGRLPQLVTDVESYAGRAQLPPTPFRIGAHMSVPITLVDGTVYGTLCCFSFAPNPTLVDRDLKRLQMAAQMAARLVDQARRNGKDISQAD